ncbi:MAG: hypothetical protein ACREU3_06185 [Steroidobacteraceae bacterium]
MTASDRDAEKDAGRRKRVRRSAIIFGMVALFFYLGFIALSVYRGTRPGYHPPGARAPAAAPR